MLSNYFVSLIKAQLPFEPNEQQNDLLEALGRFLLSSEKRKIFLLKGYAGTGKTSVVGALVRALNKIGQKTVLLAPTGRAAKVFANYSGTPAFTIHKKIYRQKSLTDFHFQLAENLFSDVLFIVDEASMISNTDFDSVFGSGNLLDDLMEYVFSGRNCSLMLLGDSAQLPPVGQAESPALDVDILKQYRLNVFEFTLTHVVRQALKSGILHNASLIREKLTNKNLVRFPPFQLEKFADISRLSPAELTDEIQKEYAGAGVEDTMVITRSNYRANYYNNGIRSRVMMKEEELSNGDLLMVTRNNYFWPKYYPEIDFIANGDILEVLRIRKFTEMYGFRFVDATVRSLDYDWEIDTRIWLDTLNAETPAKVQEMNKILFEKVAEDYSEIKQKRQKVKKIYENEFFNALQVKFAYAITCHKAQGGQWKKVFVDPGRISDEQINDDFYRWLYTALTRATENVFLVNFPVKFFS
mgnify:FL=1|jgi:exodeoxyribonuclease-5